MASAIKAKLTGSSSPTHAEAQEAEKYKLMVTAGPSYDQSKHHIVHVNADKEVYVENEFLRAKIKVRVRGFGGRGLPSNAPTTSAYFDDPVHEKDQYSIAFSFVPKLDLPSEDTVWGNDFDHPISHKLPPGFNVAFDIVKRFIDPGLNCDAYAGEPWLYGPSLSCWFAFRMCGEVKDGEDFEAPQDEHPLYEGGDGSGEEIRRQLHLPETGDKRRNYFLHAEHRKQFTFEKGRLYQADFYNPYIDFPNFSLKLPGFSMKVIKYIDQQSHCLRYVFKQRKTGEVYLNVNFHLLWGEKLEKALKEDEERVEKERQGQSNGQSQTDVGAQEQQGQANGNTEQQASTGAATTDHASTTNEPTAAAEHSTTSHDTSSGTNADTQALEDKYDSTADILEGRSTSGSNALAEKGRNKAHRDYQGAVEEAKGIDDITKALEGTASIDGRKDGWTHGDGDVD